MAEIRTVTTLRSKKAEIVASIRLKEHGFEETKASVASKLSRATMSAHFFLAVLAAIGCETVRLEDV